MIWVICVIGICWYPHSLARVSRLGYDLPIFWEAGRGNLVDGWLYRDWLAVIFTPLGWLPIWGGFLVVYLVSLYAWWKIGERVGWIWFLVSIYPMLLCLELGSLTAILGWMCLTALGSLVAGLFKPYLLVFSCIHAFRFGYGEIKR